MPNELRDLRLGEVSAVDRPANAEIDPLTGKKIPRATVALLKCDTSDNPAPAAGNHSKGDLQSMDLIELEKRQNTLEATQKAQDATITALKVENTVLKMSAREKAGYAKMTDKQKDEYMAADKDKKASMMKEACKGMDADGKDVDGDAANKVDNAVVETLLKRQEAAEVRLAKAEQENAVLKAERELERFSKRAEEELPNTAGSPEEKGTMLRDLAKALGGENSDTFKKAFNGLKTADGILGQKMKEIGKYGGGTVRKGAELEAKVQEIVKRDKISEGQAWIKASEEAPELFSAYDAEQRAFVRNM